MKTLKDKIMVGLLFVIAGSIFLYTCTAPMAVTTVVSVPGSANQLSQAAPTSAKSIAAQKAVAAQVMLRAEEWNDGMVHVWANLSESSDAYTDVPESASCTRLDDATYKIGSGSTTIRYYKLACNGVVGYVEVDQVR